MEDQNNINRPQSFGLQILNPIHGMPVPRDPESVQYALYEYKNKLEMAINEVRRLMTVDEANKEKIREKEQEITGLKRRIERMEDEKNSRSGLSGILDELKDDTGQIPFEGIGEMVSGIIGQLKGSSAPSQLAGQPGIQPEIAEYVSEFSNWFASMEDEQQRQIAWNVIVVMSQSPEIAVKFNNMIQNGNSQTRKAAN